MDHQDGRGGGGTKLWALGLRRVRELRQLSAQELLRLGPKREALEIDGRHGNLSSTVEELRDGAVQVRVRGFLAFRMVPFPADLFAAGFRKTSDGRVVSTSPAAVAAFESESDG